MHIGSHTCHAPCPVPTPLSRPAGQYGNSRSPKYDNIYSSSLLRSRWSPCPTSSRPDQTYQTSLLPVVLQQENYKTRRRRRTCRVWQGNLPPKGQRPPSIAWMASMRTIDLVSTDHTIEPYPNRRSVVTGPKAAGWSPADPRFPYLEEASVRSECRLRLAAVG